MNKDDKISTLNQIYRDYETCGCSDAEKEILERHTHLCDKWDLQHMKIPATI